ncbi:MAG TPA: TIGR00730 family Rossman fold protein, partial [Chloroflexi bacterium]|nr:TIGR00730 family Rossman fold protein [Chloroflexota bacterium]
MGSMGSVCVYCGSSDRSDDGYLQAAAEIGAAVAARGWRLVFGAGGTGMMRAVADAALARGA